MRQEIARLQAQLEAADEAKREKERLEAEMDILKEEKIAIQREMRKSQEAATQQLTEARMANEALKFDGLTTQQVLDSLHQQVSRARVVGCLIVGTIRSPCTTLYPFRTKSWKSCRQGLNRWNTVLRSRRTKTTTDGPRLKSIWTQPAKIVRRCVSLNAVAV